jgi:predicted MPP superfamily phosphohydrolase
MLPILFSFLLYGYFEAGRLLVREYRVYFDRLPDGFDGYSILHLSDFHFTKPGRLSKRTGRMLRNLPSDLAVMTGDFRHKNYTPWQGALTAMRDVIGGIRVKDGIFTCLGNKESPRSIPALEDVGITVLRNSHTVLRRQGDEVFLLGVDERNPYLDKSTEPELTFEGVPAGAFSILLSHTPDYIRWARAHNMDLMLAGDTHGGQIRLPILGPPKVKSRLSRKYCRGWLTEDPVRLFVNSGVGVANLPFRTFCPPEIVRIVLKRGSL